MNKELVICPVCNKPIANLGKNWDEIVRIYPKVIDQVDLYGECSLTENKQVMYNNRVHAACYPNLY